MDDFGVQNPIFGCCCHVKKIKLAQFCNFSIQFIELLGRYTRSSMSHDLQRRLQRKQNNSSTSNFHKIMIFLNQFLSYKSNTIFHPPKNFSFLGPSKMFSLQPPLQFGVLFGAGICTAPCGPGPVSSCFKLEKNLKPEIEQCQQNPWLTFHEILIGA